MPRSDPRAASGLHQDRAIGVLTTPSKSRKLGLRGEDASSITKSRFRPPRTHAQSERRAPAYRDGLRVVSHDLLGK